MSDYDHEFHSSEGWVMVVPSFIRSYSTTIGILEYGDGCSIENFTPNHYRGGLHMECGMANYGTLTNWSMLMGLINSHFSIPKQKVADYLDKVGINFDKRHLGPLIMDNVHTTTMSDGRRALEINCHWQILDEDITGFYKKGAQAKGYALILPHTAPFYVPFDDSMAEPQLDLVRDETTGLTFNNSPTLVSDPGDLTSKGRFLKYPCDWFQYILIKAPAKEFDQHYEALRTAVHSFHFDYRYFKGRPHRGPLPKQKTNGNLKNTSFQVPLIPLYRLKDGSIRGARS